jgi:hypothetical protein
MFRCCSLRPFATAMGMLLLLAGGWGMQWSHQWGHMVSGCAHTAHHHHHGCEAAHYEAHDEAHTWNGPHEEEQWKAHLHVCDACDSNWTPEESFAPLGLTKEHHVWWSLWTVGQTSWGHAAPWQDGMGSRRGPPRRS